MISLGDFYFKISSSKIGITQPLRGGINNGFYCGESLEQSAMFVATHRNSSLYMLKFDPENMKCKKFTVNREWMLTIAYYRGRLEEYRDTEIVKQLAKTTEGNAVI